MTENAPRVLPANCTALLEKSQWSRPVLFDCLQREGKVDDGQAQTIVV